MGESLRGGSGRERGLGLAGREVGLRGRELSLMGEGGSDREGVRMAGRRVGLAGERWVYHEERWA